MQRMRVMGGERCVAAPAEQLGAAVDARPSQVASATAIVAAAMTAAEARLAAVACTVDETAPVVGRRRNGRR